MMDDKLPDGKSIRSVSTFDGDKTEIFDLNVIDGIDEKDELDGRQQRSYPDNTFSAKKTVAQGMMDIALITANANQLRYVLEYSEVNLYYYISVTLITLSLFLQIIVGVALILKGRYDINGNCKCDFAIKLDNYILIGIFFITVINIFITSFNVSSSDIKLP